MLELAVDVEVACLFDLVDVEGKLLLELRKIGGACIFVDASHQVGGEVDDLLQHLGLQLFFGFGAHEEVGQPGLGATEVPNVDHWSGKLDVAHALTTHLGAGDFNTTTLTDDALKAHTLVLAAVALPVLGWTEDLLAEEAVLFRAERAVVDGLGLFHFTFGPVTDRVRRGETDADLLKSVDVQGCH